MGTFRIIPRSGLSGVLTNAKDSAGTTVTLYSDAARSAPVTLPTTITGSTLFYTPTATAAAVLWVRVTNVPGAVLSSSGNAQLSDYTQAMIPWQDTPTEEVYLNTDGETGDALLATPTASTSVLVSSTPGTAYREFSILADGTHGWGDGTAATDTNLYRAGVGSLGTDGKLAVGSDFQHWGTKAGFNGTTAITKPTVSGSKGANAALTSLLTALAALGLVTDSSS